MIREKSPISSTGSPFALQDRRTLSETGAYSMPSRRHKQRGGGTAFIYDSGEFKTC
jgi:hypothetical protein